MRRRTLRKTMNEVTHMKKSVVSSADRRFCCRGFSDSACDGTGCADSDYVQYCDRRLQLELSRPS